MDTNALGEHYPVHELNERLGEHNFNIYVKPEDHYRYPFADVVVPPNHYFMMGDNRDGSDDSRYWGFVEDKDVQGRAFAILMSIDPKAWYRIRWDRLKFID